jgi:chromosome segregation ATPase
VGSKKGKKKMYNKELIWVEKEFAERYKVLESDKTKNDQRCKALDEYIDKISKSSREDFKANLEALEEDAAIYTGLMLKVKQAFGKAKDEALEASYTLWEKYDEERPRVSKKINEFCDMLDPLEKKLNSINSQLGKIQTYNIDKLIETMQKLSCLYGDSREMFDFIVNNFRKEEARPAPKSAPEDISDSANTTHNTASTPCCMYCGANLLPALACPNHGFYGDAPK